MALTEKKEEAGAAQTADSGFYDQYAGEGLADITQNAMAASYLTVSQDKSDCVVNGLADAGVFFNTGTQQAYGPTIEVIPVAFKEVWDEREEGGMTVARYEPKGIDVVEQPVPPGKRGYPKKKNPLTGNEVVETYAYALVIKDNPEAGFVYMTAGLGSMKAFRRWNTSLFNQRTASGRNAPIFSKSWKMTITSKISKTTNRPYFAVDNIVDTGWVIEEYAKAHVLPARSNAVQLLLAAPVVADETVAEAE